MNFETFTNRIEDNLKNHLGVLLPDHPAKEAYHYAVLPAGKLFRPLTVYAIAMDFSKKNEKEEEKILGPDHNIALLGSAVELHHAYSLVHDDLPCMDNDDFRRNKPSTHIAFGQWQALLIGDGLLNASYGMLSKINSNKLPEILRFFSWALGPKGLIQGQYLDLAEDESQDFSTILEIHYKKTSRLIQTSMIGSFLLVDEPKQTKFSTFRTILDLLKLGHYSGLVFQFLDDLTEMADESISGHEKKINAWINFGESTFDELTKDLTLMKTIIEKYQLQNYSKLLGTYYFKKIEEKLNENTETLSKHITKEKIKGIRLESIISLLQNIGQIRGDDL